MMAYFSSTVEFKRSLNPITAPSFSGRCLLPKPSATREKNQESSFKSQPSRLRRLVSASVMVSFLWQSVFPAVLVACDQGIETPSTRSDLSRGGHLEQPSDATTVVRGQDPLSPLFSPLQSPAFSPTASPLLSRQGSGLSGGFGVEEQTGTLRLAIVSEGKRLQLQADLQKQDKPLQRLCHSIIDQAVDLDEQDDLSAGSYYSLLQKQEEGLSWAFGGYSFVIDWNGDCWVTGASNAKLSLELNSPTQMALDNLTAETMTVSRGHVQIRGTTQLERLFATGNSSLSVLQDLCCKDRLFECQPRDNNESRTPIG